MVTRWSLELPWPTDVLILPLSTATFCVDFMCVPLKSPTRLSTFLECVKRTKQNIIRAKIEQLFVLFGQDSFGKKHTNTNYCTRSCQPRRIFFPILTDSHLLASIITYYSWLWLCSGMISLPLLCNWSVEYRFITTDRVSPALYTWLSYSTSTIPLSVCEGRVISTRVPSLIPTIPIWHRDESELGQCVTVMNHEIGYQCRNDVYMYICTYMCISEFISLESHLQGTKARVVSLMSEGRQP